MSKRVAVAAAVGVFAFFALSSTAAATWSLVGVDAETGEVGVAIASCVPVELLGDTSRPLEPVALVPGIGAAVSQAEFNPDAVDLLAATLRSGGNGAAAMGAVTDPAFDRRYDVRQHAAVTLLGSSAGFTGADNTAVALDLQTIDGSAQGNILVSAAVIDDAIAAFESSEGDLASRLVAGLAAGSAAGGDSRCGDQTALFAQVAVAAPADMPDEPSVLLTFGVSDGDDENPVEQLVAAFDSGDRQSTVVESSRVPIGVAFGVVLAAIGMLVVGGVIWVRLRRPTGGRA